MALETDRTSLDEDALLVRLDRWLDERSEGGTSDGVTAALSDPWDHLSHAGAGAAGVRRTELQRIQNAGSAEDRVRSDYRGRYAIELLQNAHDACADAGEVGEVWLQVTPTALLVANQGVPFNAGRINSLLQLGDSTKAADRVQHHTIGYKGIGFSAVLEISDRPQILSRSVAFCFHRRAARMRIRQLLGAEPSAVPMRYFPFPLELSDLASDAGSVARLLEQGAVTVIRLPLNSDRRARDIRQDLESGLRPETLLFMQHLRQMTVTTPDESTRWSRRAGKRVGSGQVQHLHEDGGRRTQSWLLATKQVRLKKADVLALEDPLWATVRTANVAVALPWRDSRPDPNREDQPLHVYFPTDDRLGRAVLVHGDFYVHSSRRRVQASGRGSDVSLKIAEAAADLAAELAVSLASHGNALLRTLAPRGVPDGFGFKLGELIDARLRDSRILRPATGRPAAATASSLVRLVSPLSIRDRLALVGLLVTRDDVLRPGDDVGCEEWLDSLGVRHLSPQDLARRLTPRSVASYSAALSVLARWYRTLNGLQIAAVKTLMRQRPLLLDEWGGWSQPQDLVRVDPRSPMLPLPLRRATYQPPRGRHARGFVDSALGVEVLTPQRSLEIVLEYVAQQPHDEDAPEVLRFFRSLWRTEPALVRSAPTDKLGQVPVPARALGRRDVSAQTPAMRVYFDKRWTDNELLERLYGGFGQPEFLAVDPPAERADRRAQRQFWAALGVRDCPRAVPLNLASPRLATRWRGLEEVRQSARCPDGHFGSQRDYRGVFLDRLDQILEGGNERALHALARHLSQETKPLGHPINVVCLNRSHTRKSASQTIGYQRWLLTTHAWLPTEGGPGDRRLRRPDEAWVDVARGPARAVLPVPKSDLRISDPNALGIGSVHRPLIDRLEAAMRAVQTAFPSLDSAPQEIHDGVEWLLRKLDAGGSRQSPMGEGFRPLLALPAWRNGEHVWSNAPVIADVPGAEQLPDVEWLAIAPWSGLQRFYRLQRAPQSLPPCLLVDPPPAKRGPC